MGSILSLHFIPIKKRLQANRPIWTRNNTYYSLRVPGFEEMCQNQWIRGDFFRAISIPERFLLNVEQNIFNFRGLELRFPKGDLRDLVGLLGTL